MEEELQEWYKQHRFYCHNDYLTKELAQYLKVSPRTIQRWIKGKTHPSLEKLNLIGEYLSHKIKEISSREV